MDKRLLRTNGRGRCPSCGTVRLLRTNGLCTSCGTVPKMEVARAATPSTRIDGPLAPLVPQGTPAPAIPGGLYGNPSANRATGRRRKVNALLEKHGLRPRDTW